ARNEDPCARNRQEPLSGQTNEAVARPSGCPGIHQSVESRPVKASSNLNRFSVFAGLAFAFRWRRGPMLRIRRTANGDVVLTVSGRLKADNVSELASLLAAEQAGRSLVLDLENVVLVDRDTVRFLRACESDGITLRNCPSYIREWIAREEEQP